MVNPELELITSPISISLNKENPEVVWQVYELVYPEVNNLYELVDSLILEINKLRNDSKKTGEGWLFEDNEESSIDSSRILAFVGESDVPTCLVYDMEFLTRVDSIGDNIIVIHLGGNAKQIFRYYYAIKHNNINDIPIIAEEYLEASLKEIDGQVEIDSISIRGWDASERYEISKIVKGFPTEAYDEFAFLHLYGEEYARNKVKSILEKYELPDSMAISILGLLLKGK